MNRTAPRTLGALLAVCTILALGGTHPASARDPSPPTRGALAGQTLYAGTVYGQVMVIDTATGKGEIIGAIKNLCLLPGITEIEYDPATGRALSQTGGALCSQEIDLGRGGEFLGAAIPTGAVFTGMEVVDDTWYATGIQASQGPSDLATLAPFAGTSSSLGPTGVGPVSGLAWDPDRQVLFGIEGGGVDSRLLTLDRSTGAATPVGSTGIRAGSLEIGPDGRLYAGTGGPDGGEIYTIDPDTGASTLVGPTGVGDGAPVSSLAVGPPPVTHPPLTQIAKLPAPDGEEGEDFGFDVAVDGNIIVVGAPHRHIVAPGTHGRVYVYEVVGRQVQQIAELCASDDDELDLFGNSVAIDGDVIVAGAPATPGAGAGTGMIRAGAAYVFVKPPGGWVSACETAKLEPSAPPPGRPPVGQPHFGDSVAVRDDLIVVGAGGALPAGAAYVFEEPPGGWVSGTETARLDPSDPENKEFDFGSDVAISEDHTVGVAYLYKGLYLFDPPPGGWVDATESAKLAPSDLVDPNVHFLHIALSDKVAAASYHHTTEPPNFDATYVFERPVGGWASAAETAKLEDLQVDAANGYESIALQGNRLLVGVTGFPIAAGTLGGTAVADHGLGSLSVYERGAGSWHSASLPDSRVFPRDGVPQDDFGASMAASGSVVAVGRPTDDLNRGSVYVFLDKAVFADGFESGDTSAWSAAAPGVR